MRPQDQLVVPEREECIQRLPVPAPWPPAGLRATITDQAMDVSVTTAVVNGGFDPVASLPVKGPV